MNSNKPADLLPPVLLIGCGKMGGAMFRGWMAAGISPSVIVDRHTTDIPAPHRVVRSLNEVPQDFSPAAVILAVKPQKIDPILPSLARISGHPVIISVLAGRTIAGLSKGILSETPAGNAPVIIRAMPNTPAAIGQGMTGYYAPPEASKQQIALCESLLRASGEVIRVDPEFRIDDVTAISGSGPAYVFLLAELLEKAAIKRGLAPEIARVLARKTISGAGALLDQSPEDAADLRRNVTSPGGTTEKALAVFSRPEAWPATVQEAVDAAAARAAELAI